MCAFVRVSPPSIVLLGVLLIGGTPGLGWAQELAEDERRPTMTAASVSSSLSVDGRLTETGWQHASPVSDFRQFEPEEGRAA